MRLERDIASYVLAIGKSERGKKKEGRKTEWEKGEREREKALSLLSLSLSSSLSPLIDLVLKAIAACSRT